MTEHEFDLPAYLDRIQYAGPREPTLPALRAIIERHTAAIPFENIDVLLGREVRLDPASLQRKLVQAGRGGYCFEQNSLLLAALTALGFQVTGLMARVIRGAPITAATPRTHMILLVDLPEGPHLADVGFGNLTATAPLLLAPERVQTTPHEDYRLVTLGDEFVLQAKIGADWVHVYRFPLQPQFAIDYEVGNWFTSRRPGGLFVDNLVVARPGAASRVTLFNRRFSVRRVSGEIERRMVGGIEDYREILREHFELRIEEADLLAIAEAMRRRGNLGDTHPAFD